MLKKSPYDVIKSRYLTEKAKVLEELKNNHSNPSVAKCHWPKYVFLVDPKANKQEIAEAIETIYGEKGIKVVGVNTVTIKPKARRVRGRQGIKSGFKKAIVTLQVGDLIETKG
jgi:large subunit ribosomal protein L23